MPESQFKDIRFTKKDIVTLTNIIADMEITNGLDKVTCPVSVFFGEKNNANKNVAMKTTEKKPKAKFSMNKIGDTRKCRQSTGIG